MQKKTVGISRPYLVIIILLYIVANMFMLLSNGWYWDDWCLSSYEGIKAVCYGTGIPFMIPIHSWLINLTTYPALLYHISTGALEIISVLLLYKCLLMLGINRSSTFLLVLFFALIPYNQAKITMACFMYTFGLFFFLLAIMFFLVFLLKKKLTLRILSLFLFLCSFMFLPSTLVLALAFLLFMAVYSQNQQIELKLSYFNKLLFKLLTWADFIVIPFIFWIFRAVFLKPTGIYANEGYRELSINSVLMTPVNLIETFIQNFIGIGTVADPLNTSSIYSVLFGLILIFMLIFFKRYKTEQFSNCRNVLYIGLYFFFAGAFAYIMVGKFPLFNGYDSRHQILLRFGSAFLLFYLISLINSEKAQRFAISVFISLFIISTISCQLQHQKSWFKQIALERAFANEKLLIEGVNFVIIDNTLEYNEYNKSYEFYCYTGILYKTFGTQNRFAIDSKEASGISANYNPNDFIMSAAYHMKECKNITSFNYWAIITKGGLVLTNSQNLKMLYQYYFDNVEFENSINKILSFEFFQYVNNNE